MKFNINNAPPSEASLANARKKASAELAQIDRRESLFRKLFFVGAFVSLTLTTLLWSLGFLNPSMFAAALVVTSTVVYAVKTESEIFVGAFVSLTLSTLLWSLGFLNPSMFAAALAVTSTVVFVVLFAVKAESEIVVLTVYIGTFAAASAITIAFMFEAAVAFTALVSVVFAVVVIIYHDNLVETPRTQANDLLSSLVELEASDLPDECIQFMDWSREKTEIKAYQHQLAEQGRKPVIGEYWAAKAWIEAADQRKAENTKRVKARAACNEMDSLT